MTQRGPPERYRVVEVRTEVQESFRIATQVSSYHRWHAIFLPEIWEDQRRSLSNTTPNHYDMHSSLLIYYKESISIHVSATGNDVTLVSFFFFFCLFVYLRCRISLAWPDPFRAATYRLEIISAALQSISGCAERVWPRETIDGLRAKAWHFYYITKKSRECISAIFWGQLWNVLTRFLTKGSV